MSRILAHAYTPHEKIDVGIAGDHHITFHATIKNEYGPGTFKQKVFIFRAVLTIEYPDREPQELDVIAEILSSPYTLDDWKAEILADFNKSRAGGMIDDEADREGA